MLEGCYLVGSNTLGSIKECSSKLYNSWNEVKPLLPKRGLPDAIDVDEWYEAFLILEPLWGVDTREQGSIGCQATNPCDEKAFVLVTVLVLPPANEAVIFIAETSRQGRAG